MDAYIFTVVMELVWFSFTTKLRYDTITFYSLFCQSNQLSLHTLMSRVLTYDPLQYLEAFLHPFIRFVSVISSADTGFLSKVHLLGRTRSLIDALISSMPLARIIIGVAWCYVLCSFVRNVMRDYAKHTVLKLNGIKVKYIVLWITRSHRFETLSLLIASCFRVMFVITDLFVF